MTNIKKRLFDLGRVYVTPGALALLEDEGVSRESLLDRHATGDWGDLDQGDALENDISAREGGRILSSYPLGSDSIWVITEADRSATTLLLPGDY